MQLDENKLVNATILIDRKFSTYGKTNLKTKVKGAIDGRILFDSRYRL